MGETLWLMSGEGMWRLGWQDERLSGSPRVSRFGETPKPSLSALKNKRQSALSSSSAAGRRTRRISAFSAKVFPIPVYGSKRAKLECAETAPVENLTSHFSFLLRLSFGRPQRIGELRITVQALSDSPISPLGFPSTTCAMKAIKIGQNEHRYEFSERNVELKEDLAFKWDL